MARFLRHFTAVGDEQPAQGEDEELHEASEELDAAAGLSPSPSPSSRTLREALQRLYSCERFQVLVVCLVVLDAVFVLAELLIDLSVIKLDHGHVAPEVFHYLSLALVTFFVVELIGKLFSYRLEFFQHKFEVFDGLVVMVSFILDIVFVFHEDAFDGIGLLILLRLWRVARIINGILVSVKTRALQKMHKLKDSYDHLVQRVTELQERSDALELENQKLRALLEKHAIAFPSSGLPVFWTARLLDCLSSGLPVFWTARLLDCPSSGQPVFWTARLLDCPSSGPPVFWTARLLDRPSSGPPVFWTARLLDCPSSGLPVFWTARLLDRPSSGPLVFWTARLLDRSSSGLPVFWTARLLDCPSSGQPSSSV
ncbi:voltage-gated hydrogen channel 1 [Brachionichthys hirsutus]|uniref:voltage-gated hydrogen channel 1 n=1 Tax=Brachionichthys hirsutus TaxID=412623 RepID=UPI003604CAA8